MAAARKSTMTAEHKRALAQGRAEGRAVRAYLEALDQNRPRRGRPRTPASIEKRLKAVEAELADAAPLHRLQLVQERMDLERELDRIDAADDLTGLERDFVKVAKGYAERKGISYAAWRELGVAPEVLRKAGIGRGGLATAAPPAAGAGSEGRSPTPSVDPRRTSDARSGWGMSPTTLRCSLQMPAMSSRLPFGLRR